MANPPIFQPGFNYSNWQATNPVKPLPAQQVDNDFANAARSINQAISAIGDVRRSDGKLKNGIVGPDALAPQFSLGFSFEGTWADGVEYQAGDGVVFAQTFYAARASHTSSVSNQPPDDDTWTLLFSLDDIVVAGALSMPGATFLSDGATTAFDLGFFPVSSRNVFVTIGGQIQDPSEYTINGSMLTFVNAPPTGPLGEAYSIVARAFATTGTLVIPEDGSVTPAKLAPATTALFATAAQGLKADSAMQSVTYDPNGSLASFLRGFVWLDTFPGITIVAHNVPVTADSTTGLKNALTMAVTLGLPVRSGPGKIGITKPLGMFDGLTAFGNGARWWRASPPSDWFTAASLDGKGCTTIILGPRSDNSGRIAVPHVTAMKQAGMDRTAAELGITRTYNNALDLGYEITDLSNQDAVGTTPATLKQLAVALILGTLSPTPKRNRIEGFDFIVAMPDTAAGENQFGIGGYAKTEVFNAPADWDGGLWTFGAGFTEIRNTNVLGIYREAGCIEFPFTFGSISQGQGEHVLWSRMMIQGGHFYRGHDSWPIVSKGAGYVEVEWTASHQFPPAGSFDTTKSGVTITYTGLSFIAGSPAKLRFTGVNQADVDAVVISAAVTDTGTAIMTGTDAGGTHSRLEDSYVWNQGWPTRVESPNVAALGSFATKWRGCIGGSGDPCRGMQYRNVTPMTPEHVVAHFGRCQDMIMDLVYMEAKTPRASIGGSSLPKGNLFLAGPKDSYLARTGSDYLPSLILRGLSQTGAIEIGPMHPASSDRFAGLLGTEKAANFKYFINERRERGFGLSDRQAPFGDLQLYAPDTKNFRVKLVDAAGTITQMIAAFSSTLNLQLGKSAAWTIFGASGNLIPSGDATLDIGSATSRVRNFFASFVQANTLATPRGPDLTIASDAITVTSSYHRIDTEAAAATDNLATINGGVEGQHLYLKTIAAARDVVFVTTGNIICPTGATLDNSSDMAHFMYDASIAKWYLIALGNNGA